MRVFECVAFSALPVAPSCWRDAPKSCRPPPAVEDAYRLDSGDRVRIIIYGETSLSTDYGVDDAGDISFPMLGQIEARNATAQDLRNRIASGLVQKGILANPGVSVEVTPIQAFLHPWRGQ